MTNQGPVAATSQSAHEGRHLGAHPGEPLRLALSGGGFRATLFHVGVLRALLEAGRLRDVTHIASVSGGSVLAAHAVLNWDAFTAGPTEFEKACDPIFNLVRADIRNSIIRRLPFLSLSRWSRRQRTATDELQSFLDPFYQQSTLKHLGGGNRPQLAILGTNVGRARLCWFTANGFAVVANAPGTPPEFVGREVIPIADAVSASAAFPVLYPPKRFCRDELKYEDESKYQFVTDAGVYDNLGLSCFLRDPLTGSMGVFAKEPGMVVVSDATATIDWDSEQRPRLVQNLLRSIDIIHQRSSDLLREKAGIIRRTSSKGNSETPPRTTEHRASQEYALIDIEEDRLTEYPCVPESIQRHLSYLRTDLDAFADWEIHYLVQHGYCVTWHALNRLGFVSGTQHSTFSTWESRWPCPGVAKISTAKIAQLLAGGALRKFKWFDWRDPYTRRLAVAGAGLATCAALLTVMGVYGITRIWPEEWKPTRFTVEPLLPIAQQNSEARALIDYYLLNPIRKGEPRSAAPPAPLIEPDYRGLTIASLERVFDLRDWKDHKANGEAELGHLRTTYLLRRSLDKENVVFQFKTSGDEVRPWVDERFQATAYRPVDSKGDSDYAKRWQVDISLAKEPPFRFVALTLGCTYVNAFQAGHLDAAFKAYTDSEVATVIVLFPRSKRPTNLRFVEKVDDAAQWFQITPSYLLEHNNSVYFRIDRPKRDHTYRVQWDW